MGSTQSIEIEIAEPAAATTTTTIPLDGRESAAPTEITSITDQQSCGTLAESASEMEAATVEAATVEVSVKRMKSEPAPTVVRPLEAVETPRRAASYHHAMHQKDKQTVWHKSMRRRFERFLYSRSIVQSTSWVARAVSRQITYERSASMAQPDFFCGSCLYNHPVYPLKTQTDNDLSVLGLFVCRFV